MSGGAKAAKRPLERPLDGGVRQHVGHVLHGLRVDELPRVRAIETTNSHRGNELRIEVGEIDPVPSVGCWLQWLPVCDATAVLAANVSRRPIAPDVLDGSFRMARDLDGTELEVDPRPTDPTAE